MKTETTIKPLRVWPAIPLVIMQLFGLFVAPIVFKDAPEYGVLMSMAGTLLIAIWWLLLSRAPWLERLIVAVLVAASSALTWLFLDKSITTGMMGIMYYIFGLPFFALGLAIWASLFKHSQASMRWLGLVPILLLVGAFCSMVRTGGFNSNLQHDFAWRWSPTQDQAEMATLDVTETPADTFSSIGIKAPEWPGFRGPWRDGKVKGSNINEDWATSPPRELWRRKVGAAWSSFAVRGDFFFTQEQRGEQEVVSCYQLSTGEPVWQHADDARFWESNAGAGPRGTPSIHEEVVYSIGATGIMNALDAGTGRRIWARNIAEDTNVEVPDWGISSSPLIVRDVVIAAAVGTLAGYNRESGELLWVAPDAGSSYASPQLLPLDFYDHVVMMARSGMMAIDPTDGTIVWQHDWPGRTRIVQPAVCEDGSLILSKGEKTGIQKIKLNQDGDQWQIEEAWSSIRMKPYFSGYVAHKGYVYGFDGGRLACINAETSERQWKGGRFGSGQLVCLADQDLLIVLSERGDIALVRATPDDYEELASMPAIEGKTWNYPVLAGDTLLVRNAEEMVGYQLALK